MVNAGATIIDVGNQRDRARQKASVEEELDRVIPVLEAIAQRFEVWDFLRIPLKPEVIREAARAGAHIIKYSPPSPARWKRQRKPACRSPSYAHAGQPFLQTLQAPKYDDVFAEVNRYFIEQIARCE